MKWLEKLDRPVIVAVIFSVLYLITTFSIWKKYNFKPSSMIGFGMEFALQNKNEVPDGAVIMQGEAGNLGAGYDGQIFYYYSRTVSHFSQDWPKGFDESYRAPRIGYPLLISIFGLFGKNAAIFGMYFLNIALFLVSYFCLREILSDTSRPLAFFYLISPFSLGSYSVLVSDSVMVSIVIISYYFYQKKNYPVFIGLASLAIITKEPALFFYFPLGLKEFYDREWKKCIYIASILIIPIIWQAYLKFTFPNWSPIRLADFIKPLDGVILYFQEISNHFSHTDTGLKELARTLSRLPLLILGLLGIYSLFTGKKSSGFEFRLCLVFIFFMIFTASHYHFWSVYENISRMFTLSIPIFILLKDRDEKSLVLPYLLFTLIILALFLIKVIFIQKTQNHTIWHY